jgi:UTP--glucose-1-phosphate uridylyltransferase
MLDLFNEVGESIIAVQRVPQDQTHQYGIVEGEENGRPRTFRVTRMVEKPAPGTTDSDMAIIGRYILMPEIFNLLKKTTPGHGGEIQLTDALLALSKKRSMFAYEFDGIRFDAGDKLGYLKANVAYGLRHTELGVQFKEHLKKIIADL